MSCEILFRHMGFECLEKSDGVYRVFSPMSFPDGEPIGWYFTETNNVVSISDNANTLFRLRSVGIDVSDRHRWRSLNQIVDSFGMQLSRSGEIIGNAQPKGTAHLVSRYIGAMLAVADLEREIHDTSPEASAYIDEVEGHLKLWKPNMEITRGPIVTGHSGRLHHFDFQMAEELVEAARPHFARTGSILRKATDIQNTASPPSILVVIDDREDPEKAKYESDILSVMVRVLPFTRLANNLSGASSTRH